MSSQISAKGAAASQAERPSAMQTRSPSHAPNSLATSHAVQRDILMERLVHEQTPASATHCVAPTPSTAAVSTHEKPHGQSSSTTQSPPQNAPSSP
jgi:hypothetical protein